MNNFFKSFKDEFKYINENKVEHIGIKRFLYPLDNYNVKEFVIYDNDSLFISKLKFMLNEIKNSSFVEEMSIHDNMKLMSKNESNKKLKTFFDTVKDSYEEKKYRKDNKNKISASIEIRNDGTYILAFNGMLY